MIVFLEMMSEAADFFTKLFEENYAAMISIAKAKLKDKNEAEDAVQASFVKLLNKSEILQKMECNKTRRYVVNTIRNMCADINSSASKRREQPEGDDYDEKIGTLVDPGENVELRIEEKMLKEDLHRRMDKLLDSLSENDREILVLRYVYEKSDSEIAEELGIKKSYVRVCLKRAKDRARIILMKEMGEQDVSE